MDAKDDVVDGIQGSPQNERRDRTGVSSDGYVTEIDYPITYIPSMSPHLMRYAALIQGAASVPAAAGRWRVLELGCGPGFTANVTAAANPDVDYVAYDLSHAHIAAARALAADAGITNVRFAEASFADLAADDTTDPFDFIILHGVYTWVSEANRECIVRIIRDRIAPGGLVYLSYNAFPGWAPIIPIQKLFRDRAAQLGDTPILTKLADGFRMFRSLAAVGALGISLNRAVVPQMLASEVADQQYVTHEFLNENWKIFHFSEVVSDMVRAGVAYVGPSRPLDRVSTIGLTPEQMTLLSTVADPVERESLRDLIINRFFRADIFACPATASTTTARVSSDHAQQWFSSAVKEPCDEARALIAGLGVTAPALDRILAILRACPATRGQLQAGLDHDLCSDVQLTAALTILEGYGVIHPMLHPDGERNRRTRTAAINRVILTRVAEGAKLPYLVSSKTGTALKVDQLAQFVMIAENLPHSDRVEAVGDLMRRYGRRHNGADARAPSGIAMNRDELERRIAEVNADIRPTLAILGIGNNA